MNFNQADFPFEELDRFDSQREAINAGNDTNQIWSVVIDDAPTPPSVLEVCRLGVWSERSI